MHLNLVLPRFFWQYPKISLPEIPLTGLNTLRRFGTWQNKYALNSAFYAHFLCRRSLLRHIKTEFRLPEDKPALLCSPLHQQAGMHHVQYLSGKSLHISLYEAQVICAGFSNWFNKDGWQLLPYRADLWLLTLPKTLDFHVPSLLDLDGFLDGHSKPCGEDAKIILRLQTEIQMWLHQQPFNQTRQENGLHEINGIWFEHDLCGDADNSILYADNQWSNKPLQSPPASWQDLHHKLPENGGDVHTFFSEIFSESVLSANAQIYIEQLHKWDKNWFVPCLDALKNGNLDTLQLHLSGEHGGCLTVRKPGLLTSFFHKRHKMPRFNGVWQ
ncbi:hypothetical protein [Stenoxybacter acetivorans]|uniref:hypothetical protein n=1 Tax=Stenoxybacter acetivorans TaxID=422441 RepID=UPI00056BCD5F|nr:hypothetical protein [Stenoxybacter acetivorans]